MIPMISKKETNLELEVMEMEDLEEIQITLKIRINLEVKDTIEIIMNLKITANLEGKDMKDMVMISKVTEDLVKAGSLKDQTITMRMIPSKAREFRRI